MIKRIFLLRTWQLKAILQKAGLIYSILAILLIIGILLQQIGLSKIYPAWILILPFVCLGYHQHRKDKRILQQIFLEKAWRIYYFEYAVFMLPFVLWTVLWSHTVLSAVIAFILLFLVTRFSLKIPITIFKLRINHFWIPKHLFEWRSNFRQRGWLTYLLYFLTIIIGFWQWAGFIGIGVIILSLAGCYDYCENLLILKYRHNRAKNFLWDKLLSHSLFLGKFLSPILLFYFLKYPENWLAYFLLCLIYWFNFVVFILIKYKSYIPNHSISSGKVISGLIFLGILLPYFFPISLVIFILFYPKAIQNLKTYFYA